MASVNIKIDSTSVVDDIERFTINSSDSSFCDSIEVEFRSKDFYEACDPTTNFGSLRIVVVVDSTEWEFLLERRSTTFRREGIGFTIWGRSAQALLDAPYCQTFSDTEDTSHPWQDQTGDILVSAAVSHIVSNYCPYSVTVNWNALDYPIKPNTFSVSNQTPKSVIQALANVIGAELVANQDGSLSIETYSVDEGPSQSTFNDLDEIIEVSEEIDYSSGFNAVTVYGYDARTASNTYLEVTEDDAADDVRDTVGLPATRNYSWESDRFRLPEHIRGIGKVGYIRPVFLQDWDYALRVYYYHSGGLTPQCYYDGGIYEEGESGTEEITEDVQLIWGVGNTLKPNLQGETRVTGDTSIPFAIQEVTYNTQYVIFNVRAQTTGEQNVFFYFSDKSTYQICSFDSARMTEDGDFEGVSGISGSSVGWDICDSIVLEKESPTTVVAGDTLILRSYGISVNYGVSSAGTSVDYIDERVYSKSEETTFTNGVATLSFPVWLGDNYDEYTVTVTFQGGITGAVRFHNNSKLLTVNAFIGDPNYYSVSATVEYYTKAERFSTVLPASWSSQTVFYTFYHVGGFDCGAQELSVSVSVSGTGETEKDITIIVYDYTTNSLISGASVWIDGIFKGTTGADGELNVASVAIGTHTLKITATGYTDSDQDELDNDEFTIS